MNSVLLIVNPSAGGEKALSFETLAKEKLASVFDRVIIKYTQKAGDAKKFAKMATQEGFEAVFVMGGDGTVNEGISGLAEEPYRPKFGFFPLGTVNDLARALKMPLDPKVAIEQLDVNQLQSLDIAKVNEGYFMNVVAIGTIPQAINDVDVTDKTKYGKLAYFIQGFQNIIKTTPYRFRLTIDGQQEIVETTVILIGLTNSIGGFERILPNAKVDDGKLHLIYLNDSNLLQTLQALPSLIVGVDDSNQHISYRTFEEIEIALCDHSQELRLNVDGDEGDALPVQIKILPSHMTLYSYNL